MSSISNLSRPARAGQDGAALPPWRFRPPRLAATLVERPEISRRIEAEPGVVWLLTGPPGCGKTTMLAQHHAGAVASGRDTRWLTLTADDDDPARLARLLGHAFATGSSGWPFEIVSGGAAEPTAPADTDLFIDGLELIRDDAARLLVESFMVDLPPGGTVHATAQTVRNGPLQDARLRGLVRRITHDAFRLNDHEAARLLGPDWDAWEIQRLNIIVQGWAAGLRFMALDPVAARNVLRGARDDVAIPVEMSDFFDDVVCAGLDEAALTALMDASVLDRMSAEALAAMPGRPCPWQLVEAHVRSGSFLRHVDDARRWAAFHPAFGRHLRRRLRCSDPDRFHELQRFAASWFQANGFAMEAMRHASKMDDPVFAARLMEEAGGLLTELGNGPFVDYEQPVSTDQALDLPMVLLSQVYLHVRTGHVTEARLTFERMRAHTAGFSVFEGQADRASVIAFAQIMETVIDVTEDRPITAERIATLERMLADYLGNQPVIAASVASMLSLAYIGLTRYTEAATVAEIGINAVQDLGAAKVAIFLRVQQAAVALARETISKAALYVDDAARLAQAEGDFGHYEVVITQILRAELHYEANELDAARSLTDTALAQLHHTSGWVGLCATGFGVAAAIAGITDGLAAAEQRIAAGESLARRRKLPRLAHLMRVARLRELVRARDWRQATELIDEPAFRTLLSAESGTVAELAMQVPALLETARLMIEMGRPRDATSYLDRVNKVHLDASDVRHRFTFRLLAMRVAYGLRRYNAAVEHMQTALGLAMQAGLMRRAMTNRHALIEVFDWSVRNGRPPSAALTGFVDEVLRGADEMESGTTLLRRRPRQGVPTVTPNFTLSPRETEIIALIAEGYLTKEIATRLAISEGTVKSHRKKIHDKLKVGSKSQAIARARELLII